MKEDTRRMREELDEMKEREEKDRKRNNIIIYGKEADGIKNKEELKEKIKERLKLEVDFERVWRTGKKKEIMGAECKNAALKEEIMKGKNKLKGVDLFIAHDQTWKERRKGRTMRKLTKDLEERGLEGKTTKDKVTSGEVEWLYEEEPGQMRQIEEGKT